MNRIIKLVIFFSIVISSSLHAQTSYTWWDQIHHWDGHTPWLSYLKFSPEFQGPNSLPVPEIVNGKVESIGTVEIGAVGHFSNGDNTQNLFTKIYYPVVPRLIAIEGYVVPLEHFKMDTATRDIRAARIKSGEGTAGGDIYFGTVIQLVRDKKFPDVTFRMTCRTASGTNVSAARYTDAPGYFFDLSMGKDLKTKSFFNIIRPFGMIGFYSYQTNNADFRQDDAFLYGAGSDFSSEKITLTAAMGGYFGYINNHDRPIVARLNFLKHGKNFNYGIYLQAGLNDYPYKSVKLSMIYKLPQKLMIKKDYLVE
jgi:hypothetical protein